MTTSKMTQMDLSAINERIEQMQAESKARERAVRVDIVSILRGLGITQITARYDGYGDSGNVDDVTSVPDVEISDLEMRLKDFLWQVAYNLHPGFEINDGGYGEISWDIKVDRIDVDHSERFTDTNEYSHEDVQ